MTGRPSPRFAPESAQLERKGGAPSGSVTAPMAPAEAEWLWRRSEALAILGQAAEAIESARNRLKSPPAWGRGMDRRRAPRPGHRLRDSELGRPRRSRPPPLSGSRRVHPVLLGLRSGRARRLPGQPGTTAPAPHVQALAGGTPLTRHGARWAPSRQQIARSTGYHRNREHALRGRPCWLRLFQVIGEEQPDQRAVRAGDDDPAHLGMAHPVGQVRGLLAGPHGGHTEPHHHPGRGTLGGR
jgi:hypothetical protein